MRRLPLKRILTTLFAEPRVYQLTQGAIEGSADLHRPKPEGKTSDHPFVTSLAPTLVRRFSLWRRTQCLLLAECEDSSRPECRLHTPGAAARPGPLGGALRGRALLSKSREPQHGPEPVPPYYQPTPSAAFLDAPSSARSEREYRNCCGLLIYSPFARSMGTFRIRRILVAAGRLTEVPPNLHSPLPRSATLRCRPNVGDAISDLYYESNGRDQFHHFRHSARLGVSNSLSFSTSSKVATTSRWPAAGHPCGSTS